MNCIEKLQNQYNIILASSSPRRKKLLASIGLNFEVIVPNIDEDKLHFGDTPQNRCQFLSIAKANTVYYDTIELNFPKPKIIIAADTVVVLENKIIGKPKDAAEAIFFLKRLSGNKHKVFTGISVLNATNGHINSRYTGTDVYFRELLENEIIDYVNTGSPLDKAGGYGIQDDYGSLFVKKIDGCYNNVVGFPLGLLYEMLIKNYQYI